MYSSTMHVPTVPTVVCTYVRACLLRQTDKSQTLSCPISFSFEVLLKPCCIPFIDTFTKSPKEFKTDRS